MSTPDPLDTLEAEAIHIIREALSTARAPLLMFSAGKDSAVLLHLALRAFAPALPPVRLLHVDTGWKFREMYRFRDRAVAASGLDLVVHRNPDAVAAGINPFDHGPLHTNLWKTEGLKQALAALDCDMALGGARRDEERTRAKERIFSLRSAQQGWDPRRQRPELWHVFNTRLAAGESLRVFPLSDWTERDVWRYIAREAIPLPDLYFAAPRPTVIRDDMIVMVDDDRFPLAGEQPVERMIRFRSLGCYPLSAAVESEARDVAAIIAELATSRSGERAGRRIDREDGTLEAKKAEGYF
ncbi:MAG: sulfate adenylyltransferase subunit CysD [Sphingomonadales bacterium]|nr:sulfate adenylyltransferase subunit CysD [Sphingomonadales bacterium]